MILVTVNSNNDYQLLQLLSLRRKEIGRKSKVQFTITNFSKSFLLVITTAVAKFTTKMPDNHKIFKKLELNKVLKQPDGNGSGTDTETDNDVNNTKR